MRTGVHSLQAFTSREHVGILNAARWVYGWDAWLERNQPTSPPAAQPPTGRVTFEDYVVGGTYEEARALADSLNAELLKALG